MVIHLSSHTAIQISYWRPVINSLTALWCSPRPHVLAQSAVFTDTLWCAKQTNNKKPTARLKHGSSGSEANRTVCHFNYLFYYNFSVLYFYAYPDIVCHLALLCNSHTKLSVISPFLYNLPVPTLSPKKLFGVNRKDGQKLQEYFSKY